MSLKYTSVLQRILWLPFLMDVAIIQCLKTVDKNLKTICSLSFLQSNTFVYLFESMDVKSSDLEWQCRPRARWLPCKVWKRFNNIREKANVNFFFNMSIIFLDCLRNLKKKEREKKKVYSWATWQTEKFYNVSTQSDENKKISVTTVWHCCDLSIQLR